MIGNIVNPPFAKIGVFPLDTFYPQNRRMELALAFNGVIASPAFSAWTQGDPLDIQKILYDENGKPCTAIFSIAHLNESERMFFVTMLLNRFIDWMRRQAGTSSLKALLYMDEIFGYFPPTANGKVRFYNAKRNIDQVETVSQRICLDARFTEPDWHTAEENHCSAAELQDRPPHGAAYYSPGPTVTALRDLRSRIFPFTRVGP